MSSKNSVQVSISLFHTTKHLHILSVLLKTELIRTKGLEKINLEELVEELLPKGRALVPTKVKEDLLGQIKLFLENDADYKKLTGF